MNTMLKRLLSLCLVLALAVSILPVASAAEEPETPLTEADYLSADAVFAQIDAMEHSPAKKNASQSVKTDAAQALVLASQGYVEGSLDRNGNALTWWTDSGVRCIYSPYMRTKQEQMVIPEAPVADGIYNEPTATKGSWPTSSEVYLIGPFYGMDSSFTDQYRNEAKSIASTIGDLDGYTLYSGTAATVDKVAQAVSKGAVVIFDSHGSTDYENPYDEYDYVTEANYSYLCLTTQSGITSQDYQDGALYGGGYAYINGQVIANHMTTNSPSGILWMAICLGMATDTMCQPLRAKGVEVVYGYSQSVTFGGDYCWEETFWDQMLAGASVSTAISAMKTRYGQWDCSPEICSANGWSDPYTTISEARRDYAAFPIVVSDQDSHPGQRTGSSFYGADSLQTVRSTYTLYPQYELTASSNNTAFGTVSVSGGTITAHPATGYFTQGYTLVSGSATVTQSGNIFQVLPSSDCHVQIQFAPKAAVTVQFSGAQVASQQGYAGDAMALPTASAPEGYQFLGWTTDPVTSVTTQKPSFYTDSFVPLSSTTLYALYCYVQPGSGSGTGDYVKLTQEPEDWSGKYLIVYEDNVLVFDGSLTHLDTPKNYQEIDMFDYTFDASQGNGYHFTIEKADGGYTIQSASGYYIGKTSNGNGLDYSLEPLINRISMDADGEIDIRSSSNAHLRFNVANDQMRFRYFKNSTYTNQEPIALYRKDGTDGTLFYTSICQQSVQILRSTVMLDSMLGVRFHTNAPQDHIMEITVGDASPIRVTGTGGVFPVSLYAEDMTQPITAVLYDAQGQALDEETFTLSDYVAKLQTMDVSQETKDLAAATLTYCQYAAKLQGKYTGDLPELKALPEDAFADFPFSTSGPSGLRVSANLREACSLQLGLDESFGQGYTFVLNGLSAEPVKKGSGYVLGVPGILPQNYDQVHTFQLSRDGNQVYLGEFSVLSYLGICLNQGLVTDKSTADLMTAMYHYYAAAAAYIENP